ncbi:hypothetical protein MTR67_027750 [Solanum verrucosum]|uniref:Terpene synthase N-terminal domain-containing protein n=1 Tax=Solanum verrucosum TaxID=315347 RepID=A0AAF0R7Z7_SOLVR|nr:hypothetical protein MTR67_027750 [Solanum verrucosum]
MTTSSPNKSRPLANFHSTVWGYHFLSYTPQLTEITNQEKIEVDEYKETIRKMLVEAPDASHYISSDVFKKFTEQDGKFKETLTNDVQGLLSLYEASHLRVRDEEILEEALTFTTTHLESIVSNLSNNNSLKVEVTEALSQPIRMTLPRMGARKYISIYEKMMHTTICF